jgi:lipoprotein-anchoring transpeptidase ErfK/SrfK
LPRPVIDSILPAGLPTAGPDDLLPLAAVPRQELTPAVASPGGEPVLALEWYSDLVIEPIEARWTVVGQEPGWVRVMVPVGRGALPSVDPAAVNHQAVWVPEAAVTLEPETWRVEISLSDRQLSVFEADNKLASFPVGVGVEGVTETPVGLCSVIARVVIQTGAESLLTNCQSEWLDTFAGASWSTIAVHEGTGFNANTGGAVSNGCVRVGAANFKAYLDELPIGTPVIIKP